MYALTRDFYHPEDRVELACPAAAKRFRADGRRFPPCAYEDKCLLWTPRSRRTPNPEERALLMGMPRGITDSVTKRGGEKVIARRNSLVGNSFHIPQMMMILAILLQPGTPATPELSYLIAYDSNERYLRRAVEGTVWQPGQIESHPAAMGWVTVLWEDEGNASINRSRKNMGAPGLSRCGEISKESTRIHSLPSAAWHRGTTWPPVESKEGRCRNGSVNKCTARHGRLEAGRTAAIATRPRQGAAHTSRCRDALPYGPGRSCRRRCGIRLGSDH